MVPFPAWLALLITDVIASVIAGFRKFIDLFRELVIRTALAFPFPTAMADAVLDFMEKSRAVFVEAPIRGRVLAMTRLVKANGGDTRVLTITGASEAAGECFIRAFENISGMGENTWSTRLRDYFFHTIYNAVKSFGIVWTVLNIRSADQLSKLFDKWIGGKILRFNLILLQFAIGLVAWLAASLGLGVFMLGIGALWEFALPQDSKRKWTKISYAKRLD